MKIKIEKNGKQKSKIKKNSSFMQRNVIKIGGGGM